MTLLDTAVIRGPKDKNQFRNDPDNWTGYIDPLPACNVGDPFHTPVDSVSTKKTAWPKGFLTQWMVEQAATCAVEMRDQWQGMECADAIAWIAGASERQRDAAADRGHQVHHLLETLLEGGTFDGILDVNDATAYIDTLKLIVEKEQPHILASEVVVYGCWVDPHGIPHEWMGTFDAVWLVDGKHVLVDYKSRKTGKAASRHSEEGAQVGGYSMASYWIVEDDTGIRRMAPLRIDAGMILSIAPDGYRKYWIDDIEQARHAWERTLMFKHTIDSARLMFGRAKGHNVVGGGTDNPPGSGTAVLPGASGVVGPVDGPDDIAAAPVTSPAGTVSSPAGDAILHEARTAWAINRTDTLVERLTAQHVAQVWPVDLPRPKAIQSGASRWSARDIDIISVALDALEAKHDVAFGEPDPKETAAIIEGRTAPTLAPKPQPEPQPVVEGEPFAPHADVLTFDAILAGLLNDPDPIVQAKLTVVQGWQREGAAAGHGWYIGTLPKDATPLRLLSIVTAAIGCMDLINLDAVHPDQRVRDALATALDDHDTAQMPVNTVGALFGLLTTEQAETLADT